MYAYGKHLGLAFQVVDDILDFTQSTEQLGKPQGQDLASGNLTAPVIFALQVSRSSPAPPAHHLPFHASACALSCRSHACLGSSCRVQIGSAAAHAFIVTCAGADPWCLPCPTAV